MQAERIIKKAKQLGINISSSNTIEGLEEIAIQLGLSDFDPILDANMLESRLDSEIENLEANQELDSTDTSDAPSDESIEENDMYQSRPTQRNKYKAAQESNDSEQLENNHGKNKLKTKNKQTDDLPVNNQNRIQSKINSGSSKINQLTKKNNPLENIKNSITNPMKNKGKLANSVKNITSGAGKILSSGTNILNFLSKYKFILIGIALVLFIIIIYFFFFGNLDEKHDVYGYYESECNFNEVSVTLENCGTGYSTTLNLDDYVIGTAYSYIKDGNYANETIKALMIILKTNALSNGYYSNNKSTVKIDDCNMQTTLTSSIDNATLSDLEEIYSEIEEELFISSSYNSTISNLSGRDSLEINVSILDEIESFSSKLKYSDILKKIYNTSSEDTEETEPEESYRKTIFVGDSRMNGMRSYEIVNNDNSVYAGAMGYYWFSGNLTSNYEEWSYNCPSNPIECVNDRAGSAPANIVIWLGVNDVSNYEKYYEKYYELATGEWSHNYIYIASVGYVDDNRSQYANNAAIDTFNKYMETQINGSGLDNLKYIDLGFTVEETIAGSGDGVHYYKEFSQQVYDRMLEGVGGSTKISSTKKIYRLSSYCTYYTLIENDAYWWPIGSEKPTKGNVYGGEPTSTFISSYYGWRTHPVYGDRRMHTGIDIAAGEKEVAIATKAGTVTIASDSCTGRGDGCNGGAGNMVVIDHGDGVVSRYLHLYPGSVAVEVGQTVKQGQKVGLIGSTGTSTGDHLHFEIIINGSTIDPLNYISSEEPRFVNPGKTVNVNDSVTNSEETKIEVCKALLKSGFSKNAVAAILVNVQAEGGFLTNNLEDDYEENRCRDRDNDGVGDYGFCMHPEIRGFGSDTLYTAGVDSGAYPRDKFINDAAGYGLIQWTYHIRKAGLYDYAKSEGKSIAALSVQLEYLLKEIEGDETTYKYITGNYEAYDIANVFCQEFERPDKYEIYCPIRARDNVPAMLKFVNNGCSN